MNKTNFNQAGGFPLKTERLQELQTAYEIFNHLGNIAGNLSILSGCAVTGSSVTDGVVVIDNEVIVFKGGYVAANVIIIEEAIDKEFEDGSIKKIHTVRYATFGTAATSWPWASFKKPIETKAIPADLVSRLEILEKKNAVFQSGGGMVLWNKPANQIPVGWAEVINWRGRMPIGFDASQSEFNTMGKIGGDKIKQLTIAELPEVKPETIRLNKGGKFGGNAALTQGDYSNGLYGAGEFIKPFGGNQPFSIMNPYRVVLFIEYIG
ncbi:hypothetical protein [Flavobacterium sp. PL02]|jgi:hypothetical protein|uniref:hypothetical protein n=1 Tax=Flavobacterium sp. PL02 TaxID=3088354 RepID=UPI002B23AE55|nr:hypothetical protein [Flavobacterium sp. PL02]MEA9414393.1 hypothetical protein [Flavobacterium sp. PL02]